ncbi:sugar ABC transporter substrate-binding protein [Paenibacillus sp. HB172176]|uniref:ABC transporter substrate-binding protein n=1 Tax=Paenibacillus sp. HB172176 TaxID=2493690 RepID=UPI00143BA32C|nr:sugar ABC transporter substrate-binding protein [Paenibacillus sp. HB172176]
MFKKRTKHLLLAAVMMTSLIAGCSSNGNNNDSNGKGSQSTDKKTELTFVSWSSEESSGQIIKDLMVKSWNDENQNAPVNVIGYPWKDTLQQLIIKTTSKEKLDIAQIQSSWLIPLADQDVLVDLNTVLDPAWMKSTFSEAALKGGQVDGHQYALPWTIAAIAPLYNPELLEKAGVDKAPTTIAEFEDALKKVKESIPDVVPYAISTESASNISQDFQAWLWTFGGHVFDENGNVIINNENGVKALQWLKDLKDKDYIQMGVNRAAARDLFGLNQAAFYDDSIVARGFQVSKGFTMEDMPSHMVPMQRPVLKEGDTPRSILWGHYLVVFKSSKAPDKSAEFIQHLLKDDLSIAYFKSASVPPVTSTAKEDPIIKNDSYVNAYLDVAQNSDPLETENFTQVSALDNIISEEFQAALLDAKSPQKALDDAAARIADTLK